MMTYDSYTRRRAARLKSLRAAGFQAPAKRFPKLSRAALDNRGEAHDYLAQLAALAEAVAMLKEAGR